MDGCNSATADRSGLSKDAARQAAGIDLAPASLWQAELDAAKLREPEVDIPADARMRYLAGQAVRLLAGRAPPKEVVEYLRTTVGEVAA